MSKIPQTDKATEQLVNDRRTPGEGAVSKRRPESEKNKSTSPVDIQQGTNYEPINMTESTVANVQVFYTDPTHGTPKEEKGAKVRISIKIDKVYNNKEYLLLAMKKAFMLTDADAKVLIGSGWNWTKAKHKVSDSDPFGQEWILSKADVGKDKFVAFPKESYDRMMGAALKKGSKDDKKLVLHDEILGRIDPQKAQYATAIPEFKKKAQDILNCTKVPDYIESLATGWAPIEEYSAYLRQWQELTISRSLTFGEDFAQLKEKYPSVNYQFNQFSISTEEVVTQIAEAIKKEKEFEKFPPYVIDAIAATALQHYLESRMKALGEVIKSNQPSNNINDDIIQLSVMASKGRKFAFEKGLIDEKLFMAWGQAYTQILVLEAGKGKTANINLDSVVSFYDLIQNGIAQKKEHIALGKTYRTIPKYISPDDLSFYKKSLETGDSTQIISQFNSVVTSMDDYINDTLTTHVESNPADKAQQDRFNYARQGAEKLEGIKNSHPEAVKIQALYYPKEAIDGMENVDADGRYKIEEIAKQGVPLSFYLHQEENKWVLSDLTTPDKVKVNSGKSGAPNALFGELDSKIRFAPGTIYWTVPACGFCGEEASGRTIVTGDSTWRDWLGWIGLGVVAVGIGLVTFGTGTAAVIGMAAIVVGTGASIGTEVGDMMEKSEHGMLDGKEIALSSIRIAADLATLATLGTGKIVMTGVGTTGKAAQIAKYADNIYVPLSKATIGLDVAAVLTLTPALYKQYLAIQAMEESDKKNVSMQKLLAHLLLVGGLLVLSGKDIPNIWSGKNIKLTVGLDGEIVATKAVADQPNTKGGTTGETTPKETPKTKEQPSSTGKTKDAADSKSPSLGAPAVSGLNAAQKLDLDSAYILARNNNRAGARDLLKKLKGKIPAEQMKAIKKELGIFDNIKEARVYAVNEFRNFKSQKELIKAIKNSKKLNKKFDIIIKRYNDAVKGNNPDTLAKVVDQLNDLKKKITVTLKNKNNDLKSILKTSKNDIKEAQTLLDELKNKYKIDDTELRQLLENDLKDLVTAIKKNYEKTTPNGKFKENIIDLLVKGKRYDLNGTGRFAKPRNLIEEGSIDFGSYKVPKKDREFLHDFDKLNKGAGGDLNKASWKKAMSGKYKEMEDTVFLDELEKLFGIKAKSKNIANLDRLRVVRALNNADDKAKMLYYIDKLNSLEGKGITGVAEVLGSFAAGGNPLIGAKYTLEYIDGKSLWPSVAALESKVGNRYYDIKLKNGPFLELKSVNHTEISVTQLEQDIDGIINQKIKWVFDSSKNSGGKPEVANHFYKTLKKSKNQDVIKHLKNYSKKDIITILESSIIIFP